MNRITLLLVSLLLILLPATRCQAGKSGDDGKNKYPSAYKSNVIVNGNVSEWPSGMMYYDAKAKAWYTVANDAGHVFFCLVISGRADRMPLLRNGFSLWINENGRKKKSCSVTLTPVLPEGLQREIPLNTPQKMIPKQPPRTLSAKIVTSGFRDGFNGELSGGENSRGFSASFGTDSTGMLALEVGIPFTAFMQEPGISGCMAIGFEIMQPVTGNGNGRPPDGPRPGGPGGSMEGHGDRGPGGGSMEQGGPGLGGPGNRGPGTGGSGEPPSGSASPDETVKIWHKFSIALAP